MSNVPWKINNTTTIYLLTLNELDGLPDGTELISINGHKVIKGIDYIDRDTRSGLSAFGLTKVI